LQTSVRIHRGDSIIADGIKKGWALLPAKRPAGPVIHKLVDPLGNSLPGLYAIQIPSRRQFTDALSDMRRSFSAVLLDDLLRGGPEFPVV